ncbi:hypothetical protein ENSA5_30860 [Enhygromyxa salina]|uniref:Uncharacterized protein n=1 Tax=Enhygromyxa salina TaxID=215803 RepID=A0A2S9XZC4_9BACT|nr:hypothetical protein [Enhygromyxa salina]PRP98101.1 hypothetical protein ENSA5_30860 [Enhygromyxa salina]
MSWREIGEARLDEPVPDALTLRAPSEAWPHVSGGAAGNGRVALELGYTRGLLWTCELPEGPPVLELLALGDRVLALRTPARDRRQRVELIDGEGRHVRTIEGLCGDWAIDVPREMLVGRTTDAELGAWSLRDPQARPILVFNRLGGREVDALRFVDDLLIALTHEPRTLGGPPSDVMIDVVRIPSYGDLSRWRTLRGVTRVAERITDQIDRAVIGLDPAGVILATEHELWWGDWRLRQRGRRTLEAATVPLRSCPRDDGSGWLLAEHEGRTQLWQVVVGKRIAAHLLDAGLADAELLVGPDDGVVVPGSTQVASFDPEGAERWSVAREGDPTGLIDEHGIALFSDAGSLISMDSDGARATVWIAPESIARLGPLAATNERLWVGADRLVFGLR